MSTIEQRELQSNNGWQNIGMCVKYARSKNIPDKLFSSYIMIVEESFGYCKHTTRRISLTDWAKKLNIARSTVIRSFEELERLEFIEKYKSNKYITDGGSEAFCYAPNFPKTFGQIKFKEDTSISGSNTKIKEPEINKGYVYDENKQF